MYDAICSIFLQIFLQVNMAYQVVQSTSLVCELSSPQVGSPSVRLRIHKLSSNRLSIPGFWDWDSLILGYRINPRLETDKDLDSCMLLKSTDSH